MKEVTTKAPDYEQLRTLLEFWCRFFPKKCASKTCNYRFQCKNKQKQCEARIPNQNKTVYTELSCATQISTGSIQTYYKKLWGLEKKPLHYNKHLKDLEKYLIEFQNKPPYESDPKLQAFLVRLKELYDVFDLSEGCNVSEDALSEYIYHSGIIRYWALFRNRNKDWDIVRDKLKPIVTEVFNSDEIKQVCYLALFESYLNEWTQRRHEETIYSLIDAKNKYLIRVPKKEKVGQYHYFKARFLEEEWWKSNNETKRSGNYLIDALNEIRKSIDLYRINHPPPYDDEEPWWLLCHEVILLKLLEPHSEYDSCLNKYGNTVIQEALDLPKKKSLQMYAVTNFLIRDEETELLNFFDQLNKSIQEKYGESHLAEEEESEVDNFSYHHAELIFFENPAKLARYRTLLQEWFKHKKHKKIIP